MKALSKPSDEKFTRKFWRGFWIAVSLGVILPALLLFLIGYIRYLGITHNW